VTLGMHLCSAFNRRTANALDNDDDETATQNMPFSTAVLKPS